MPPPAPPARGVQRTLRARGGSSSQQDEHLYQRAGVGDMASVKRLLASGANPNHETKEEFEEGTMEFLLGPKSSALHAACRGGHLEIAQLLVDKGATLDKANGFKRTPLHRTTGTCTWCSG